MSDISEEVPEVVNPLENNKIIRKAIPRLTKPKGKKGRPKKYTPTKMRNNINKYFEACELNDDVPSIKGLMIHLGLFRDAFYKYLEYPEFNELMEHTRMIISNWLEADVYRTGGMAAGKIAYMKNVHNWADKIDSTSTVTQTVITVDQAKAKIEMLAPKLLELLKNSNVIDQIKKKEKVIDVVPEKVRRVK